MRLYRGKALSDGRWVYGYYRYYKDRDVHKIDRGDQLESGCDVDGDTVGQYTGLKDKSGVECYQYDVIKYPNNTIEGYGLYVVKNLLEFGFFILERGLVGKFEVVGENTELVKGSKIDLQSINKCL